MEQCNFIPDGEYELCCTVHKRNDRECRSERIRLLETEMSELRKELAQEEADHLETIKERDELEEVISQLAADAGCEREWSNLHSHGECITSLWADKVNGLLGK